MLAPVEGSIQVYSRLSWTAHDKLTSRICGIVHAKASLIRSRVHSSPASLDFQCLLYLVQTAHPASWNLEIRYVVRAIFAAIEALINNNSGQFKAGSFTVVDTNGKH